MVKDQIKLAHILELLVQSLYEYLDKNSGLATCCECAVMCCGFVDNDEEWTVLDDPFHSDYLFVGELSRDFIQIR